MQIQNVFFADDDADDRLMFKDALKEVDQTIGFQFAIDGQQALKFLKDPINILPDYIFLDLRMPRISGKRCLVEIKEDKRLNHIPVIIFSTSSDVEDSKQMLRLGAAHFISKPSNPEETYYILSQVLSEKWA